MNKEALAKLTKARAALILDHPFFGSLALRLKLIERTNMVVNNGMPMRTMAVDGTHIFYHPDFVNRLSLKHVIFVVAHEVMHCVWSHMTRRGNRDPGKWNRAGDYVINDMLKSLKATNNTPAFEMPDEGLWSPQFSGPDWTADKVYNLLPDDGGGGSGGPGNPGDAFDHVLSGDPDAGPQDASTRAQAEREWKVATIQAANAARMAGELPSQLERFLDGLFKPQVDWAQKLRNFVNEVCRDDYTWSRPNRRFDHVYLPSLFNETMGEIVVVVDDSGSISDHILQKFGAEIKGIMEDARPSKTHLIYCDSEVAAHYELGPDDTPIFKTHGGGGTDFRPPFALVEQKQIEPKCLIYLTDLEGPHGDPPEYPVLWVCINDHIAPWGETVPIAADE